MYIRFTCECFGYFHLWMSATGDLWCVNAVVLHKNHIKPLDQLSGSGVTTIKSRGKRGRWIYITGSHPTADSIFALVITFLSASGGK